MDFSCSKQIEIRSMTDNWGPYSFSMAGMIPATKTIDSVIVYAYMGKLMPESATMVNGVLTLVGETTVPIIDTDFAPVCTASAVAVKFKYPGDAYKGPATLIFLITLSGNDGVYPFFFDGIVVQ